MKKVKNFINCFKNSKEIRKDYFIVVGICITINLLLPIFGVAKLILWWDLTSPFLIIGVLDILLNKHTYTENKEEMLQLLAERKPFIYVNKK